MQLQMFPTNAISTIPILIAELEPAKEEGDRT